VTFFLIGVWHGRTSQFVFFGVLQGGGVAINKRWQLGMPAVRGRKRYRELAKAPVYVALGRGLTFTWFSCTLFWFWGSWNQIDRALMSLGVVWWLRVWLAIWILATAGLALWERIRESLLSITTSDGAVLLGRYARVIVATALALVSFVMTGLLNQPAPEIIYKPF